jgi:hypothetical protein
VCFLFKFLLKIQYLDLCTLLKAAAIAKQCKECTIAALTKQSGNNTDKKLVALELW